MAESSSSDGEGAPTLFAGEFAKISQLAYEHFGLDLQNGKEGLVAARLGGQLRDLEIASFQAYYDYVIADRTGVEMMSMVDHLTTNHTCFYREPKHFEFLRKQVYPKLRGRAHIDIWSAGCSSGEEPYSIAMSFMEESSAESARKVRIKATDISSRVLAVGKRGIYPAELFKGFSENTLRWYLLKGQNGASGFYRFKGRIRDMIEFSYLNLIDTPPTGYKFPVIFCRNVMIYFDKPTRHDCVFRLLSQLEDGGYFFIGHSESLNGISHGLECVSPAIYRKPRSGRRELKGCVT